MLPQAIIDKILAKYGKEEVYSGDCAALAASIGVSETTVKRMLGLVGEDSPERHRVPHNSTMDIVSRWLGYSCYKELLEELNERNVASEFTSVNTVESALIEEGTQIRLRYEPSRLIVMTYLGKDEFVINESKNSKLIKGDRIKLTHLVLGQEMIVMNVVRNGVILGGFRGGKDGGLSLLEIIE